MKNINYKYVSLVLGFVLVVTYAWSWNCIFSNNSMSGMNMNMSDHMQMMQKDMVMGADGKMYKSSDMVTSDGQEDNMNMQNTNMGGMMMNMLANMKGKSGADLEKAFLTEMIKHHQGAVDMARELLKDKSIRPELAKFANDIITAQSKEILMQKSWLKSWYGINK